MGTRYHDTEGVPTPRLGPHHDHVLKAGSMQVDAGKAEVEVWGTPPVASFGV